MKFYSENLNKLFNTEKELIAAEEKAKAVELAKKKAEEEKKKDRAARAKEVEEALKVANAAQADAIKKLKAFINDYGYFHTSYTTEDADTATESFFDILNDFLG